MLKPRTIRYGPHRGNVGDLWLPADRRRPLPVVVLIHGGFWRALYTKRLMNGLAKDVVAKGWAAWNIEYPGVSDLRGGGRWPTTLLDVAAALDHLEAIAEEVDVSRVVVCGHSAGGQLALWAAGRHRLPTGSPGAGGNISLRGVVSLSGIVNLEEADRLGLGAHATARFMGGHYNEQPDRYRHASPCTLLPLGLPQALIHAGNDSVVPASMGRDYERLATHNGDSARFLLVDGIGTATDRSERTRMGNGRVRVGATDRTQ